MRLHVLESIAQYHSGDPVSAKAAMAKAKQEFQQLDVDQEALEEVKANGYTEREAR